MTYTTLRDFLDRYTNKRGEIQGDPAIIAGEAATAGLIEKDDNFFYWICDEWRDEPEAVMGAIIGALCAVQQEEEVMTIAEARDIIDRYAMAGRLEPELIEALYVTSRVLSDIKTLQAAAGFYIDIAEDREADGIDPAGTGEAARALARAVGIEK